jgi:hypothetical protein
MQLFFSSQVMEDAGQDLVVRVAERRNDTAALPAHAPRGSGGSRQESFEDEEVGWSQHILDQEGIF